MTNYTLFAIRYTLIFSVVFGLLAVDCAAQPASSTDLINNAKQLDGQTVEYKGEVIGDIMKRGDYAWLNVNDGSNAIGIWAPVNLLDVIVYKGAYGMQGDIIEVKGVFSRSCRQHGGDFDIHADTITIAKEGCLIDEPLDKVKLHHAVILGITLFLILVWKLYSKARYRI